MTRYWGVLIAAVLVGNACSSEAVDRSAQDASTNTGGAGGSTLAGGGTGPGAGGRNTNGSGGIGPVGGAGGTGACCLGCNERCTPATSRGCGAGKAQDCRCDGSGWEGIRFAAAAGGYCPILDAGRSTVASGGSTDAEAPGDASPADAGTYCVYQTNGTAGAPPSTYCQPLPHGCASCSCITLPFSYCTCTDVGGVSVRCLGQ